MANMFTNYDNDIKNGVEMPCFPPIDPKKPQLITNIKGDILGIQVDHTSPCHLCFHLENMWEVEDLTAFSQGCAVFEVLTTTHKVVMSREYALQEIWDQFTNEICIYLSPEDLKELKLEAYNMKITIKTALGEYVIFTEKDGRLIIR